MKLSAFLLNFKYAFRPRKPLLTLRLAGAVLKGFLKKPFLRYVDFAIDFRCNLKCEHCFATALNKPGRRVMKPEDYARVAQECMDLGAVNFSFQGGEPLLSNSLEEIVSACKPSRNVISITTNGTVVTSERIKTLKKTGVDILTISLDSANAEEHDRFRGMKGAFDKTMQAIQLALKEGLHITLGTVVTHQTLRSKGIDGIIALAKKLKTVLYLILPVPAGRWAHNSDIFLTEDDERYIDSLTKKSPYVRTDFQANLGGSGCGAAKEILYLTPYGDVLVCPFIHIAVGNIFEEPVKVIRERALSNSYFASYHQKCLASTDAEFIQKHLSKTFDAPELPIRWDKVFK